MLNYTKLSILDDLTKYIGSMISKLVKVSHFLVYSIELIKEIVSKKSVKRKGSCIIYLEARLDHSHVTTEATLGK